LPKLWLLISPSREIINSLGRRALRHAAINSTLFTPPRILNLQLARHKTRARGRTGGRALRSLEKFFLCHIYFYIRERRNFERGVQEGRMLLLLAVLGYDYSGWVRAGCCVEAQVDVYKRRRCGALSLSLLALSEGGPAPPAAVMPAQAGPAAFYRPECISMRARSDARLAAP
jgi:hypothetical protein